MALTVSSSNYGGDLLAIMYKVLFIGNELVNKGIASVLIGISDKRSLPKMSQTADPFRDYTTGEPAAVTVTTTYEEVTLTPQKTMLYEDFLPEDWKAVWEEWQPDGDFTNLELNTQVLQAMMDLYMSNSGEQMAKVFWQGDSALGANNPLNIYDGIIKQLTADGTVIAITPAGVITESNVVDRIEDVWESIPDKFFEDMDYKIAVSMADFRLLQKFNNDAKKTTVGVLSQDVQDLFLNKRIVPLTGMPKDHIVAGKMLTDSANSNFFLGTYVPWENENPKVDLVDNMGKLWGIRIDAKVDATYRVGSEIVFYKPV